jgi:hypothetical protein
MSFRQYRPIESGEFLVAGFDMAMGGPDYSACAFISKTKVDIPLIYHAHAIATEATNEVVPVLEKIYQKTGVPPVIAPERNSGGVFEIDRMVAMNRTGNFKIFKEPTGVGSTSNPEERRYGWTTTSTTRPKMLEDLKNAIDNRLLGIYDSELVNEMFAFVVNQSTTGWKAQAESGAHDDIVMAAAIAFQVYQKEEQPRDLDSLMQELPDDKLFTRGFYG